MKFRKLAYGSRYWSAALCLLMLAATSHAESLDIATAYRRALQQHPTIALREGAIAFAGYELDAAEWQRYPSVAFDQASAFRQSAVNGASRPDRHGTNWRVQQPIWTGGRLTAEIKAANLRQETARLNKEEAEHALLERVAEAYIGRLRVHDRLAVALTNVAEHDRLFALIERRSRQNVSSRADLVLANARLQQARSELASLQQSLRRIDIALEQLLGSSLAEITLLAPPRLPMTWESQEDAVLAGSQNSPLIRRQAREIDLARAEADAKRAALLPQLSLRYEKFVGASASNLADRWMLAVEYQPGAGLSVLSASRAAAQKVEMAGAEAEAGRRELVERISEQYQELRSLAEQKVTAAEYAEAAGELVASYLRQFTAGKKTWQEVLNAQREAAQAAFASIDTASGEVLASHRLAILTGELSAARLQAQKSLQP